jgi:hypothetical protein
MSRFAVATVDASTGDQRVLTYLEVFPFNLSWGPDGSVLLFTTLDGVYLVDVASGMAWPVAAKSTRHDILARDLDDVDTEDDCTVVSGLFDDPYTGERIEFTAEDPHAVQIDHVVPLALAWRLGAAEWDRDQRVEFANDPRNLLATDGPANMHNRDSGPGDWQPYEGYRCSYAVIYIDVTHHYDLPLPSKDREGLEEMLETCA